MYSAFGYRIQAVVDLDICARYSRLGAASVENPRHDWSCSVPRSRRHSDRHLVTLRPRAGRRVPMRDHGRTHLHFHFVVFLYIPRFTPRARGGMARGRTFFEAGCVMGFELPTDDSWDAEVFLGTMVGKKETEPFCCHSQQATLRSYQDQPLEDQRQRRVSVHDTFQHTHADRCSADILRLLVETRFLLFRFIKKSQISWFSG